MRRLSAFLRRARDDRSGASALTTSLAMIVVLGAAGLGTDVSSWYAARRDAQHAADSAAVSAAAAMVAGGGDLEAQARAIAATYGVRHGQNGVAVVVRQLSSPDGPQVEVVVERPARRFFSRLFLLEARTIRAGAVAQVGGAGDGCVLALDPSEAEAILVTGSTDLVLNGCSLIGNSKNATAMKATGSADVSALSVILGGGYSRSGSAKVVAQKGIQTNQPAVPDPYAAIADRIAPCDYSAPKIKGTVRFDAYGGVKTFCNGLSASGTDRVEFGPGTYIFDRGELSVSGSAELYAPKDVTFIFTSSTRTNYASFDFSGTADITIHGPQAGPYAGIAIYQSRETPRREVKLTGSTDMDIQGAIYLPTQDVTYSGSTDAAGGCKQLIGRTVTFTGSSGFGLNCTGIGVAPIGASRTKLVR